MTLEEARGHRDHWFTIVEQQSGIASFGSPGLRHAQEQLNYYCKMINHLKKTPTQQLCAAAQRIHQEDTNE